MQHRASSQRASWFNRDEERFRGPIQVENHVVSPPQLQAPATPRSGGREKVRVVVRGSWLRSLLPVLLLGVMMFTAVFIGRYGSLDPCNMVRQEMTIQGRMLGGRDGELQARALAQQNFDPFVQSGQIGRPACAKQLVSLWTRGLSFRGLVGG